MIHMANAQTHLEKLADLKEGTNGIVREFTDDKMASKLLSMGVLPGKSLRLVRRVPFGGGLYIKLDECNIAVRDLEAQNIMVEVSD
jgi:ferrous iron transport protein A